MLPGSATCSKLPVQTILSQIPRTSLEPVSSAINFKDCLTTSELGTTSVARVQEAEISLTNSPTLTCSLIAVKAQLVFIILLWQALWNSIKVSIVLVKI